MNADPLRSVIRLRRLARDEAMRELAAALDAAARADQAVTAIRRQMADEESAASATDADDLVVEAFGRWLRRARADLTAAESVRGRTEAEIGRVRALLIAARAALEAAEAELQRRTEAERAAAGRREQATLDEFARNGPRPENDRPENE